MLNVVALVSGGKDSFFAAAHVLALGHRLTAVANLHPPDEAEPDSDSFMFQTAGHGLVPCLARALRVPLYRQPIAGGQADPSLNYAGPARDRHTGPDDETESLVPLLARVLADHPGTNAVCAGAVLSTYQRTRIEAVAARLGLAPLAPLWQFLSLPGCSAPVFLDRMGAVGIEARVVKVASGGLDERALWVDVVGPAGRARIAAGIARFASAAAAGDTGIDDEGAALIGEGGEYETVAVDGPVELWKGRLEVELADVALDGGAAVQLFGPGSRVVEKEGGKSVRELELPGRFDAEFGALIDQFRPPAAGATDGPDGQRGCGPLAAVSENECSVGPLSFISNVTAPGDTAEAQMASIVQSLQAKGAPLSRALSATLILRNIADFAAVNRQYSNLFTGPLPPARVAISCGLPNGALVSLSLVLDNTTATTAITPPRAGLHVQSRSFWAPANIGPYSQAIYQPDTALVWLAGQIPLDPATMTMYPPAAESAKCSHQQQQQRQHPLALFHQQACLALQHLFRVCRAGPAKRLLYGLALLPARGTAAEAQVAADVWTGAHARFYHAAAAAAAAAAAVDSDDSDIDVWDRQFQQQSRPPAFGRGAGPRPGRFPSFAHVRTSAAAAAGGDDSSDAASFSAPPVYAVRVQDLPAGAPVEWASLGSSAPAGAQQTTSFSLTAPAPGEPSAGVLIHVSLLPSSSSPSSFPLTVITFTLTSGSRAVAAIDHAISSALERIPAEYGRPALAGTRPYRRHSTIYAATAVSLDGQPHTVVPCSAVFENGSRRAVLVVSLVAADQPA